MEEGIRIRVIVSLVGHGAFLNFSSKPIEHVKFMALKANFRTLMNALLQILAIPVINQTFYRIVPLPQLALLHDSFRFLMSLFEGLVKRSILVHDSSEAIVIMS